MSAKSMLGLAIASSVGGFLPPSQARSMPAYRYNPGAAKRRKARKAQKQARRKNRGN